MDRHASRRPEGEQEGVAVHGHLPHVPRWHYLTIATLARVALFSLMGMLFWAAAPTAMGWVPTTVMTDSMRPRIIAGDVVIARPVDPGQVQVGQVLLVDDPDHAGRLRLHRLVEIKPDNTLILRGDANSQNDSTPVARSAVHGVAVLRVPFVGTPIVWIGQHRWELLVPLLLTVGLLLWGARLDRSRVGPGSGSSDENRRLGGFRVRRRYILVASSIVGVVALILAQGAGATFASVTANASNTFAAASNFCSISPADTPSLFYPFAETSGSSTADISGSSNTGTLDSGATRVAGSCVLNGSPAVALDGSTGYINTSTHLTVPTSFSLEIWFKSSAKRAGYLIGFGDAQTGPSATPSRYLSLSTSGALAFTADGSQTLSTSTNSYYDGNWHMAAATVSSGTLMTLYIDGAKVSSKALSPVLGSTQGWWRMGYDAIAKGQGKTDVFLAGTIDNAAVYPTALTDTQVLNHYNTGH